MKTITHHTTDGENVFSVIDESAEGVQMLGQWPQSSPIIMPWARYNELLSRNEITVGESE